MCLPRKNRGYSMKETHSIINKEGNYESTVVGKKITADKTA